MARDVHNWQRGYTRWRTERRGSSEVTRKVLDHNIGTYHAYRADAHSTARGASGEYHYPTTYYAVTNTVNPEPWNTITRWLGTPLWENQDFAPTGSVLGISAVNLGGIPSASAEALNRVRTRIRSRIRDSDLDAGIALGEARESLRTIRSLLGDAKRLASLFSRRVPPKSRTLNRVPVRDLRALPGKAAREYLRVIYGILPILRDIYALANHSVSEMVGGEIALATARLDDPNFGPDRVYTPSSPVTLFEGKARREVQSSVTYTLANPLLFELWRVGLTNPLAIAWELTTLSFVVDWFTGLGSWIDSLQDPLGLVFLHGYETVFEEISGVYKQRLHPVIPAPGYRYAGDEYANATVTRRAFSRQALGDFPHPPMYFSAGLSDSQMVSAIALIVARFSK